MVLTATWLLPVALVPMAWDAGDIHGPPIRPPSINKQEPEVRGNNVTNSKESKKTGSKFWKSKK